MNRDFFKVRKWNILKQPNQSPAFNSIVDVLHLKKIKVKSGQKDPKKHLKTDAGTTFTARPFRRCLTKHQEVETHSPMETHEVTFRLLKI